MSIRIVMKKWPCIFVVCTICLLACESETPAPDCPSEPSIDDLILKNCLIVQAAAEAFAKDHDGEYAFKRTSYNGPPDYSVVYSLVDYLPDSTLLTNPVTGEATEPQYWIECCVPFEKGSTAYRGYGLWDSDESAMRCVGYYILGKGLGKDGDIVITNVPDSVIAFVDSLENVVRENCMDVVTAASRWAGESGGGWPSTPDEVSPLGHTLIDFLPGGQLLENPYTNALTEPIRGIPHNPGETGYYPVVNVGGANIGCVVSGYGCCFRTVVFNNYPGGCDSY